MRRRGHGDCLNSRHMDVMIYDIDATDERDEAVLLTQSVNMMVKSSACTQCVEPGHH